MISWVDSVNYLFCVYMKENKEIKNKVNISLILKIVFVLTPIISSMVLMIIQWILQGYIALPGVKWNDEAAYIKLIETYAAYLSPKGYWGFDSNHALLGTGSAWNFAILAPYALLGKIFPVGYSFVYICNLVFITLANLIFILLTKPQVRNLYKLILAEATSVVFLLYINTNMSEIYRYALAIVIAGLLYKIFFDKCPLWIKYVITPIVIVYSVQVYTFFAFCIPIYVFAILKNKKLWVRIVVSIASMGIIAGGSYVILHMISSNYNIGKTEALLNAIKAGRIFGAARSFLGMVYDGLMGLINLRYYVRSNGIYIYHVMIAILIIVTGLMTALSRKAEKKDRIIGWIVVYSVSIFGFMYMTLYTIVPDTFMRGTEIVVLFSIVLLMMTEDKWLALTIVLCNLTGLLFMPANYNTFYGEERYYTKEVRNEWRNLESEMSSLFEMSDSENPYDNTILMYTMEPRVICAMPRGFGINFVLNSQNYGNDSMYIVMTKHDILRADWVEQDYRTYMNENFEYMDVYYEVIYESNEYICFKKK